MPPTPYTLGVKRRSGATKDAHGNVTSVYADPLSWPVSAIAPGDMTEPGQPNRDLSTIAYTVYAPKSDAMPAERDRVVLNGDDYEVDGRPEDWTQSPWPAPFAGVVVKLTRAEG